MFNLHRVDLRDYQTIFYFIKGFDPKSKWTVNSLALLKGRDVKLKSVPRLKQGLSLSSTSRVYFLNLTKGFIVKIRSV
jgi:hypothetical protein